MKYRGWSLAAIALLGVSSAVLLSGKDSKPAPARKRELRESPSAPPPAEPPAATIVATPPVPRHEVPPAATETAHPEEARFEERNLAQLQGLRMRLGPDKAALIDRLEEAVCARPDLFEVGDKPLDSIHDLDGYVATFGPYQELMREILTEILKDENGSP